MAEKTIIKNEPWGDVADSTTAWTIMAVVAIALVVGLIAIFRGARPTASFAPGTQAQPTIPNTGAEGAIPSAGGTSNTGGTGGGSGGAGTGGR